MSRLGAPRRALWRLRRFTRGEPLLHDYVPVPMLRVPAHPVTTAAVAAVDAHNHLGRWLSAGRWQVPDVGRLLADMAAANVAAMVNLDGRWGDELEHNLDRYDRAHPGRFATFCHVDWSLLAEPGPTARAVEALVASLQRSAAAGARGLKVWKDLGLAVRDARGDLVLPDDPRLADVWAAAGELGLPVLIHVGDPPAFFAPADRHNERLEELLHDPALQLAGRPVPPLPRLLAALDRLAAAHPGTRFVGAHVAGAAEDLAWVDRLLTRHANLWVDTAGRMSELGRQPRAARRLVTAHPTRIVWGSDVYPPSPAAWRIGFRFLETDDEHFPYGVEPVPAQGRWAISGLGLPADVLAAVYRDNVCGLVPGLGESAGAGS